MTLDCSTEGEAADTRRTGRALPSARTRYGERMEDPVNENHIRGLPEKVDRAEVGSDQSERRQGS